MADPGVVVPHWYARSPLGRTAGHSKESVESADGALAWHNHRSRVHDRALNTPRHRSCGGSPRSTEYSTAVSPASHAGVRSAPGFRVMRPGDARLYGAFGPYLPGAHGGS